jgi:glycosyltransferase involved in cell wall biosynthesis
LKTPRVTVCIPTYNRAHFLRQALHSLCNQGLTPDEYVVAISDNASTDQTSDVVEAYKDKLQIIFHRNTENLGHGENFRIVTDMCQTPYIVLLPDDDLLAPGHLGRALSAFDAHEGAVLVSSLAVIQRYPGAPQSYVHGTFLRATAQTSYTYPYVWDQTEWMALALVTTPLSLIGSVFQSDSFRLVDQLYKSYMVWGDRLLLAEMGVLGGVLSLPWVGGYYRTGEHQTNQKLGQAHRHEFSMITQDILNLCKEHGIPVIEFWIEQICLSTPEHRVHYLDLLKKALPSPLYEEILHSAEASLKTRIKIGRLEQWGTPRRIANLIRKIRDKL